MAYATGARSDYGIVRRYLALLDQDERVELSALVTGTMLDRSYGNPAELVEQDGLKVDFALPVSGGGRDTAGIMADMGKCLEGFGAFFQNNRYDLLIVLGDRYEMFSVATAAAMQRIPILHIHGGEATYGNYDEFMRHAITKMSRYHFTATEEYRRRVIQLGEDPGHVWNLGALGAENCKYIDIANVPAGIAGLQDRGYYVFLFHPETLTAGDIAFQTGEVLRAADLLRDKRESIRDKVRFIFLGSNADTGAGEMSRIVQDYVSGHEDADYYENLHPDAYHHLVKHSICLIGNSSSGLIEAPSLGVCTVNIGDRQAGRVRGESVYDVPWDSGKIADMALRAGEFILSGKRPVISNPYAGDDTAKRYYETTLEILNNAALDSGTPKVFRDITGESGMISCNNLKE